MKKKVTPDILRCLSNPRLFGSLPAFKSLKTWRAWFVWLCAVFALPITDQDDMSIFQSCTQRKTPPQTEPRGIFTICGRRSGKSWMASVTAVFLALFRDYKRFLTTGEKAVVLVLARDREQARVVFSYIRAILRHVPVFSREIVSEKSDEIELRNGITIMVKTSDYRAIRGITIVVCICDEIAFWETQGVNPDKEILAALRPAMATIPNSKLLVISTPYSRAGALFETYKDHFGQEDSDLLVWQAPTSTMNPTIDEEFIRQELERDPDAGRAEWMAQFREDVEAAFPMEMVEACVIPGRVELPAAESVFYKKFADPSGGRRDPWALAVGHVRADGIVVVDLLKTWPAPFDPSVVTEECASIIKAYGDPKVEGDNFGAEWPVEQFWKHGVEYTQSKKVKSDLYLSLIPALCSKKVELPDHRRLMQEFRGLERRRGRSGKDSIDNPRGHDDLANVVAGLVHSLIDEQPVSVNDISMGGRRISTSLDFIQLWGDRRGGGPWEPNPFE